MQSKNNKNPPRGPEGNQRNSPEEKNLSGIKSIYSRKFTLEEQEDFQAWKKQADKGLANAQLQAGLCYEKGKGVEQSYELAFQYYKLAADQGNVTAQLMLGMLYENGQGSDQSYTQALRYYKLAARKGSVSAQILLGGIYSEGKGVQKSPQKAVEFYEKAAAQGHPSAYDYLAEAYKKGIGVAESQKKSLYYYGKKFQYFKKEADTGDSTSQAVIGMCYANGEGVEKSLETAFYYYKLSADQHLSLGLYHTAECYALGRGIQKSTEKAIYYYKEAAYQGHPLAQASLGLFLLNNKIDENQGVAYLKQAIGCGECGQKLIAACANKLGQCFERGIGVERSDQTAVYYYRLAVEKGDTSAQHRLGDAYLKGELGLDKSANQAIPYYKLAADQGWSLSLEQLGSCYEKGEGVEQSSEKAFHYYQLAAEIDIKEGSGPTILSFARCYELGIGIEKSLEKAIHYFKLAAENGISVGYYKVGCCYRKMGGEENRRKSDAYFKMFDSAAKNAPEENIDVGNMKHTCKPIRNLAAFPDASLDDNAKTSSDITVVGLHNCFQGITPNDQNSVKSDNFLSIETRAQQGEPEALLELALFYERRIDIEQYKKKTLQYYEMAADKGLAKAQIWMGDYFYNQNTTKAFEYYMKAAYQGSAKAQNKIGLFFERGKGVKKNYSKAFEYYKLAADQGYPPALFNLADCYENGTGVEKSIPQALNYYKQAADQGYANAMCILGDYYERGILIEKSLSEAFRYYKLAEEQGSCRAVFHLARCYEYGMGCDLSYEKAIEYYFLAIKNDYKNEDAAMRISIIQDKLLKKKNKNNKKSTKILEVDSEKLENQHLESIRKQKRQENINRAYQFFLTLPANDIKYPESQELDLSSYIQDRRIDKFKELLTLNQDRPIYLNLPNANYEEIIAIRDAMIINPRITFFCSKQDYFSLWEAFHQGDYPVAFKRKIVNENGKKLFGIVFIGTNK